MRRCAVAVTLLFTLSALGHSQTIRRPPAVPVEPFSAILDAFKTHQIVALGEGPHGNEQGHLFRLSLILHPRFAMMVNDIVVEFGNSRYQQVMDRFVAGEDVPYDSLRQVWQNTTHVHPADAIETTIVLNLNATKNVTMLMGRMPTQRQVLMAFLQSKS